MSHISKVEVEISDLDALESACAPLGLRLNRGATSYKWFGRSVGDYPLPEGMTEADLGKCLHSISVIGMPNAYEIGVVQKANGKFALVWDFWNGGYGLQDKVGAGACKLITGYSEELFKHTLTADGYSLESYTDTEGTRFVVATSYQ